MSAKYRNSSDVPTAAIVNRLNELSDAITGGSESMNGEFTMRVPAECDRDADLVLAEAARRLEQAEARVSEYGALVDEMDKATRLTYLSGPVVVEQFKRLRQKADESERAGGEK